MCQGPCFFFFFSHHKCQFWAFQLLNQNCITGSSYCTLYSSLLPVQKLPKQAPKPKTRLTQMRGSMYEEEKITIVEQIEKEKAAKQKASNDAKAARNLITDTFFKCKFDYICNQRPCAAIAFKECSICHKVYKSQCMKKACKRQDREMLKPVSAQRPSKSPIPQAVDEDEFDSSETTEPSHSEMDLHSTDSDHFSTDFHAGSTDDSEDEETALMRQQVREELMRKVLQEKWAHHSIIEQNRSHLTNCTSASCGIATASCSRMSRFTKATKKRKPLPDPQDSSDDERSLTDSDTELVNTSICPRTGKTNQKSSHVNPLTSTPIDADAPCTEVFNTGDYVQVQNGMFKGWFAVVVNFYKSEGQYLINYYCQNGKYWQFKDGDTDLVYAASLKRVKNYKMDKRNHVYFNS